MKVAFCIREDYDTRGGGDVVQMLKTKFFLEKDFNDVQIEIVNSPEKLNSSFDICHIFNYSTYKITNDYFVKAKNLNLKIASSPIYWDYKILAYALFSKLGFHKLNKFILGFEIKVVAIFNFLFATNVLTTNKFKKRIIFFLSNSNVVLPNSEEEMDLLCQFVRKNKENINYKVALNASDSKQSINTNIDIFSTYKIPNDFILQVGRIEPIKNQLSIVKALFDRKEIPIVFIGAFSHKEYTKELKKQASKRGNVFFINEIPHSDIYEFYKKAKLHILPSLRESPGLVSLEAISMGCEVIVSKFPYSPYETYFRKYAYVIDPLDVDSIKKKILEVLENKFLRNKEYSDEFSWEVTACQTYEAYKSLMNYDS
ncbi:glycosyltransferase [Flavobacterium davisii]|uniref:glycosyltransferase n=1 Tax=Flavobacterium davisii TaxID=2906077 RepID=UPI0035CE90F8